MAVKTIQLLEMKLIRNLQEAKQEPWPSSYRRVYTQESFGYRGFSIFLPKLIENELLQRLFTSN